jgi:hypothetical protein
MMRPLPRIGGDWLACFAVRVWFLVGWGSCESITARQSLLLRHGWGYQSSPAWRVVSNEALSVLLGRPGTLGTTGDAGDDWGRLGTTTGDDWGRLGTTDATR